MKQYRTILGYYIVCTLLFLVSNKFRLNENLFVFSEIIFIFGIVSIIGLILAIIPIRKKIWIKILAILFAIIIYIHHADTISINKILMVFIVILLLVFASIVYSSFDNVCLLWKNEKRIKKMLRAYQKENMLYGNTIKRANSLYRTWREWDTKLGITPSLREKITRGIFSDEFKPNIDLESKYPQINYNRYIGYYGILTTREEIQKIIRQIDGYSEWITKTENRIRNRNEEIESWIEDTQKRTERIVHTLHIEKIPEEWRDDFKFYEDAKIFKEFANKKRKFERKVKKGVK